MPHWRKTIADSRPKFLALPEFEDRIPAMELQIGDICCAADHVSRAELGNNCVCRVTYVNFDTVTVRLPGGGQVTWYPRRLHLLRRQDD